MTIYAPIDSSGNLEPIPSVQPKLVDSGKFELLPIKFVVGSKMLFSVDKMMQTRAFSLADVIEAEQGKLGGQALGLTPLSGQQDGYQIFSAPIGLLDNMAQAHPQLIMGGLQTYRRHYIDMRGSFDDYMGRFSSKTRSTLRRKHRKLIKQLGDNVEFREYRTADEIDEFCALALPLSRKTYQAKSLDAALPDDDTSHVERRALAAQGRVRAFLLCADGVPISYLYLPIEGATVSYAFLGYDPAHAKLSPGTVLQLEALERLFAEGCYAYFDFTEGEGAHKAMFGTDAVDACSFFLLNKTMTSRLLLRARDSFDAGISLAKRTAQKAGALASLRRTLRKG